MTREPSVVERRMRNLERHADALQTLIGTEPSYLRHLRAIYVLDGLVICSVLLEQVRGYPMQVSLTTRTREERHQFHIHASTESIAIWLGLPYVDGDIGWLVDEAERQPLVNPGMLEMDNATTS